MDKFILITLLLLSQSPSYGANSVDNSVEANSKEFNSTVITSKPVNAQDWNLSVSEWQEYLKLMQGPSGHYYQHMTPPEVLGINAETDRDLKHYAEVSAKQEHEKVEKELRFDHAFQEAAKRLYANEPIIRDFDYTPFSPAVSKTSDAKTSLARGDHIAFFVDINAKTAPELISRLITQVKNAQEAVLDIYCVNYTDDESLRNWAKSNSIPIELVVGDKVTINKSKRNMELRHLPYALLVHGGDSRIINLDDV
jgi:integrating conjugative element protein (TIGR03759 family)